MSSHAIARAVGLSSRKYDYIVSGRIARRARFHDGKATEERVRRGCSRMV